MQQRQRIKNLEKLHIYFSRYNELTAFVCVCVFRFSNDPNGLLLASDVAARGLDVPQIQHIIHYQVPKSTEVQYILNGDYSSQ